MAKVGRFDVVEPERAGRFEVVPDIGRFELVSDKPGPIGRAVRGVREAFTPQVEAFQGAPVTGVSPRIPGAAPSVPPMGPGAALEALRLGLAGVFPGATAAATGVTGALEGPAPEPLDVGIPGPTGFETLPGGLPGAPTLAGALAAGLTGGARGLVRGLRRPGVAPVGPTVPPAPEPVVPTLARPTPITDITRAQRAIAADVQDLARQIDTLEKAGLPVPKHLRTAQEAAKQQFNIPRPGATPAEDVATKAAIVRAQRAGPRVVDPETGQPVFEPGEPISAPRTEAIARAGREPVGRADLPSEELAASTEAPGGRAGMGAPPTGRQPGSAFVLPDETTTVATSPVRGSSPEVAIAANIDIQVPPSVGTVTWADRALNWLRATRGRINPKVARQLGQDLDIAKAHPSTDAIVQAKYRSHARMVRRGQERQEEFWGIWEGAPDEQVDAVMDVWKLHRFEPRATWLERAGRQFPQFTDRIARTQQWFDDIGQQFVASGRLTEKQLAENPNYFPWLRERIRVDQSQLNLIENRGVEYFSVWRGSGLTKPYQEFFQRQVKGRTAPKNLKTRDVIRIYGNAIARAEVLDSVFMPTVRAYLKDVPVNMQAFIMHNINNFLGVEGAASKELAQWQGIIKSAQAQRTLTGLSAPAHNLTQQTITLAKYGFTHGTAAYGDMGNRALWDQARRMGIISKYSTKDFEEAVRLSSQLGRLWERLGNIGLAPFRHSEQMNRVHALATGLRAGRARGLEGKALDQFAFRAVIETQGPLVKTGVMGQFKTFPLFMVDTYKSMLFDIPASAELLGRGLAGGNPALIREAMKRGAVPARWLALTVGLFGGDAIWPALDEKLTKRMLGEAMKFEGAIPYFGIQLAHVVGTGAIPVESYQAFLFFLPGPAAANVAEATSVLTGLRLNPFHGKDYKRMGEPFRTPQDLDEMRARLVRAIPLLGAVQVNRLIEARKRAVAGSTPETAAFSQKGDVVAATDWYEAFGMAPASGELIEPRAGVEPASVLERLTDNVPLTRAALEAAGFRPEASSQISEHMRRIAERNKAIADTRGSASTLMATGDDAKIDLAVRRLEALRDAHGEEAFAEAWDGMAQGINQAILARAIPRLSRRIIQGSRTGVGVREELGQRRGVIDTLVRSITGR